MEKNTKKRVKTTIMQGVNTMTENHSNDGNDLFP